ncbi:hypothetical protein Glove_319g43 [Diversispora epigaea]|uniref:Uncharacterized protein n=1 Tax=Diversispora epigaea TaxID=1348612 RepID=A0A397HPH7_9GLOM|nr:hypothetical protein Glove_319g43 [Diversispora epigaea]
MQIEVPDEVREKCVEFTENFNCKNVDILLQKLVHNGTWKESKENLVKTTVEILNGEGTYVTDIIVPLIRAILKNLPTGELALFNMNEFEILGILVAGDNILRILMTFIDYSSRIPVQFTNSDNVIQFTNMLLVLRNILIINISLLLHVPIVRSDRLKLIVKTNNSSLWIFSKLTLEDAKQIALFSLSTEYKNIDEPLTWRCQFNHQ